MDIPYQEINSKTIDRWVEEGWELSLIHISEPTRRS